MSRKIKQKSFLEEQPILILNAAIKRAEDNILEMPPLLVGQEPNLYINQATEIARIEMIEANKALSHLIDLHKEKLSLLEAKEKLFDAVSNLPASAASQDTSGIATAKLHEIRSKLIKGDLGFLTNLPEKSTTEIAQGSSSFIGTTQESSITSTINRAFIEKPKFSSTYAQQMEANYEAQQSARRHQKPYTPGERLFSVIKNNQIPLTIEEKENNVIKNVFQSGGSSLDGSYIANGVTYEEIMRPKSVTPSKGPLAQPNFDDTIDAMESVLPPIHSMKVKPDLGPIPMEKPQALSRPTFISSFGQRLNQQ